MPPPQLVTVVVLLAALGAQAATEPEEVHAAAAVGGCRGNGSSSGLSIVSSKENDGCARLLGNGLFSTFEKRPSASSSAAQTALQTAMCSAATEIVELATTRGGVRTYGIFVEDAALRLALSAKEAGKRLTTYRRALCGMAREVSPTALDTFAAWLDPNVITSYSQCVDMFRRGLSMEPTISRDGLTMTITLGYVATKPGSVTYHRNSVSGPVQCRYLSASLRPGASLNATSCKHAMQCDRTNLNQTSDAASVIVSTSAGTRSFDFPDLILPTAELRLSAWLEEMQEAVDSSTSKLAAAVDKLQRDTAAVTAANSRVVKLQKTVDGLLEEMERLQKAA